MDRSGSESTILATLSEEYLLRLRRGEHPTVAEYCDQHPDLADEIRTFFPTLKLVEHLAPESHQGGSWEQPCRLSSVGQLGDYRIVREIGRGGMGIVFQARQESLGRTVALKVLAERVLPNPQQQKRFIREAKAAARLHHSNIVPIFGVGNQDGLNYYVMQLIQGVGLNEVIVAVRRRRDGALSPSPATRGDADEPDWLVDAVSHDRFSGPSYWRRVAEIGIQVGKALTYAHDQGVVHRDIKPANLIMDRQGTIWVTDFGLAKSDDQDDLTRTGDVVGTIRYIAPEQFDGQGDARSDLFSLGLTLYELLALRPAFDAESRHQLIKQVTNGAPPRLGHLDASIPVDLQNVIHKSIERDPSRRYEDAAALTDDLQRFLEDRPIRARPISTAERVLRWSRRHPAAAVLAALLTILSVISPLLAVYFGHLVLETRQAHRQAQLSLFESRLAEARASRYSSRPGQHFESLKALAEAVRLGRELAIDDPVAIDQMRGHATAALALTDLQVATRWSIPTPSRHSAIHFDSDLAHFTVWDRDALSVRRVTTGQEVSRLPVNPECFQARFSPNDQWICVSSLPGAGDTIQVWDWRRETLVYRVGKPATEYAFDFSPDSRQLAIGHEDGSVSLHDLVTLRQIAEFQVASAPITVAFHPTKPLLAVNCRLAYCTQLWTLDPIRLTRSLQHPSDIFGQCWGPGGRLLAVVEGYDIHLWDVDSPSERPMRILRGHNWVVSELRFHPSGRMLLSNSWREGKTGVWNPRSGEHLLWQDGCPSRFSRDGTRHAFCDVDTAGIWNVSAGEAQIFPPCYASSTVPSSFCGYSPDGQLLASAGDRGVHFWDTTSWQLLLKHAVAGANSVRFQPRAQELLVASRSGLHRYQWTRTESGLELIESGHTALPDSHFPFHLGISADGQTLVADLLRPPDLTPTGKMMLLKRGQTAPKIVMGEADLRYAAVSPDGRWAASGNWRGNSVSLWDAQSGRPVMRLPTQSSSVVAFSPDSALMVFADIEKLRWVETGSWRTVNELQRSALVGSLAFSPDGRVIATTDNESTVQLVETSSGRILASLSANDSPTYVCWLAFHPGGNQLAVCRAKDGLRVWDLRRLREGLQSVGLDWR